MTDREKLVELLLKCEQVHERDLNDDWEDGEIEAIADHLIANGVTVRQPTDLTGKCGSCAYARPTTAFGGSKCYVACKNPEKRFKGSVAHIRQRTCKACKMYKPLPESPKEEEA